MPSPRKILYEPGATKILTTCPSKLTPEVQATIAYYISKGNYVSIACRAAGIDQSTLANWLAKARDDMSKGLSDSPCISFFTAIEKAFAEAEANTLASIHEAGEKSWQARAWTLERTRPQRYAEHREHRIERIKAPRVQIVDAEGEVLEEWGGQDAVQIEGSKGELPEALHEALPGAGERPSE